MKQRILHLRASNFVGGPEKQILRYASYDFDNQVEPCIGSFCGDREGVDLLRVAANRGIATLALPASSLIGGLRSLIQEVRESNVRLICAHGYKPSVVAALAARVTHVPYVCFLRGWTKENRKVAFYESLEKLCSRRADYVVCLSEIQAAKVREWVHESRVRVVINAAKVQNYTRDERQVLKRELCALAGFDPARPLVVAAGRLSPEKGMANLVCAAKTLQGSASEIQFAIFGDGVERRRLQHLASSFGLDHALHFVGHRANFADLVAGADLLVNPSLSEEMPNVVLEAMSAGVPIAATAVGGVPELAVHGAIALLNAGDASGLSEVIADLVRTPSKCRIMVQKARERLEQNFSPEKQAEQLKSLYGDFLILKPKTNAPTLSRISVVIPVRNEERHIAAVLQALRTQDYPSDRFEIVVADGGSSDRTAEIVAQYASQLGAPIRLVQNPSIRSSSGRNVGVAASKGEIIVFVDGHCHVRNRNLLKNISRLFDETGADILCRPQPLDFPTNSSMQKVIAAARASWLGHGHGSTIYSRQLEGWVDPSSAGAMYRRDLFSEFGGFDETFDACEDVEFNYRLHQFGMKAYISPELTVLYEPRKTLRSLFGQMLRYGKGRVRLARKHPSSFSSSQLMPAALVLFAALGSIAVLTPLRYVWVACMAVYLGIVVSESVRVAKYIGVMSLPTLPLTFIAIHAGLGAGFILEWVNGGTYRTAGVTGPVSVHISASSAGRAHDSVATPSVKSRVPQ